MNDDRDDSVLVGFTIFAFIVAISGGIGFYVGSGFHVDTYVISDLKCEPTSADLKTCSIVVKTGETQ